MSSTTQTNSGSKKSLLAGRIISALSILFLSFDAVLHLMVPAPVVEAFARLGVPLNLSPGLGMVELVCIVAYAIPSTSVLGAILLTGYLGGAIATHVRAGSSLFETVFPIIIGALIWAGVFFREERLRAVLPLRS